VGSVYTIAQINDLRMNLRFDIKVPSTPPRLSSNQGKRTGVKSQAISYVQKLLVGAIAFLLLLLLPAPTWAATPARVPLTLELLQERINSPIPSEGVYTIDLRRLIIDLKRENSEFRDQFYQQLQNQLNRSKKPLGLDLSESLIQGEFTISKLGLSTPLSKAALSPLLTPSEQEQLQRDVRFLSEAIQPISSITVFRGPLKAQRSHFTGAVNFANTFFLHRVEASDATFTQEANWSNTRFGRLADFSNAIFSQNANFSSSSFFGNAKFSNALFRGATNFTGITFYGDANFTHAEFEQLANFSRIEWLKAVDFSQVYWRDRLLMSKSRFTQSLLLADATFEKSTTFRESQFEQPVLLRGVSLLDQIDFSSAQFAEGVYLDVTGLTFDSNQAKLFGDEGQIGRILYVSRLNDNEDVLRNLVRNFREQEQIADANQLEYTTERLRREQLHHRLTASNLNTISPVSWVKDALSWVGLGLLLLLSKYGTSFGLVFSVGMIAIACFGLLFWLIDRWRRRYPQPILPTYLETTYMIGSFAVVTFGGVVAIFRTSDRPWLTLLCLGGILLPVPLMLLVRLYQQGRYHDLIDVTYFVEDASMRQLRLLIGRLPIRPRFEFFRDRYMPILWDRRWNWLNYYDFSLNNLLKLGFNDIRLRDEHLPGIITALVWYQWSLGILYIALLLWTLSRTIPGLNLLIYLK
jgi:hypothetical protein